MLIKGSGWWGCALKVLRYRLDGVRDLPTYRDVLRLCEAVHTEPLASVRAANSRKVAIVVVIAFLDIPEAFGEGVLRAFARDTEEG